MYKVGSFITYLPETLTSGIAIAQLISALLKTPTSGIAPKQSGRDKVAATRLVIPAPGNSRHYFPDAMGEGGKGQL